MDVATIGGLICAIALVVGSILLGGGLGAFVGWDFRGLWRR